MSRAQLTSTVEQNTGGAVSPYVAGKNFIINGDCSIAQRGTSFTSPSSAYTLDRWCSTPTAGGTTWTVSQVASFLTGSKNAIRTQRASGQTGTPAFVLGMAFETNDVIKLQGQVVTWSFYAKAGADFSAGGLAIGVQFNTGTGTDQGPFVGHTGEITQINTTATLSKTIANRYTYTFTVPTNATSARWNIYFQPTSTAATNDYYDVTNMQLEIGSVATPFSRAGGTIQGELAACQRYYWRANAFAETSYPILGFGAGNSATQARTLVPFPVQMRIKPVTIDYSTVGGFYVFRMDDTQYQATGVSIDTNLTTAYQGWLSWAVASGLTANTPYYVRGNNNSSYYLGFSAEL